MKTLVKSDLLNKYYYADEVVRILNAKQVAFYISKGAKLLDIYASTDRKDGSPVLVCIFSRTETQELYDRWCLNKKQGSNPDENK